MNQSLSRRLNIHIQVKTHGRVSPSGWIPDTMASQRATLRQAAVASDATETMNGGVAMARAITKVNFILNVLSGFWAQERCLSDVPLIPSRLAFIPSIYGYWYYMFLIMLCAHPPFCFCLEPFWCISSLWLLSLASLRFSTVDANLTVIIVKIREGAQ